MDDDRPPAMFIAESRALDFLNSIATPLDKPIEFIGSGEHLLQWLRDARLLPSEVLDALLDRAVPCELDYVSGQARAVREGFYWLVHRYRGKPHLAAARMQL